MSLGEAFSGSPRGCATARHGIRRAIAGCALALALLAACQIGPTRKPTFVGRQDNGRAAPDLAEGLNPMASVEVCPAGEQAPGKGVRVLVSPPTYFSRQATEMIVDLRRSLVNSPQGKTVQMWLAPLPLRGADEARAEGMRCAATIVLWETYDTNTLELTLPQPAEVPLRHMVRERLCEFGSDRQQVAILFFTISGLAAMVDNRYDEAVYYMEAANRIDVSCFQLPTIPPRPPGDAPLPALPPPAEARPEGQQP